MATNPAGRDPIAEEAQRLLDEDPALRADLVEFDRRLNAGEVGDHELLPHSEARGILKERGLLPDDEPTPE